MVEVDVVLLVDGIGEVLVNVVVVVAGRLMVLVAVVTLKMVGNLMIAKLKREAFFSVTNLMVRFWYKKQARLDCNRALHCLR